MLPKHELEGGEPATACTVPEKMTVQSTVIAPTPGNAMESIYPGLLA